MSEEMFYDFERSQEYAEEMDQIQLVGMKLGDEEYAIDVLKITEIIRTVEITIVPRMESYILGVMNLRGKVVPVIDLRVRFNLDSCDFDKSTRIIVVSVDKENIGFVVDEVTEVIRIKRSMVEPTPPLVGSIGQEYILGICKYDSRLIMLLDIDRVIDESGRYNESELRKKMLGSTKTVTKLAPMPEPVAALEPEPAPAPAPSPAFDNMLPDANSVAAPVVTTHEEDIASIIEKGSASSDIEDNIDALIAKETLNNSEDIEIVDSQNLSTGIGLLVLKMCKFRNEGFTLKEIKSKVEELVPKVSTKFCIDRLDYLYEGGRCSGMTKIVAHALKIHPIAKVINNKLSIAKLPRGKYANAVDLQIEEFKNSSCYKYRHLRKSIQDRMLIRLLFEWHKIDQTRCCRIIRKNHRN